MAQGRRRKPLGLKVIAGGYKPTRDGLAENPKFECVETFEVPEWFDGYHKQVWDELYKPLKDAGVLTEPMMAGFCVLVDLLAETRRPGDGPLTPSFLRELRAWCTEFGITPHAAGQVRLVPKAKAENPYAKFLVPPATDDWDKFNA